jgi:predicted DNA-binding protein YlxM (UPF0122 family)
MLLDEKIDTLQIVTKRKITYEEIGDIFGVTRSAIQNRISRKQPLKDWEEKILDDYYEQNTQNVTHPLLTGDRIEITYWQDLPEELKNPRIISCWFDREIIENAWGMSADHLCIVPMIGDKMTRYWYPIRSNDILIVDTSQDYIMGNGVYFATSRNNTRFWIREMQVLLNNDIEFKGFSPSGDTTKVISKETLEEADFRLVGKVIKNVSFRL